MLKTLYVADADWVKKIWSLVFLFGCSLLRCYRNLFVALSLRRRSCPNLQRRWCLIGQLVVDSVSVLFDFVEIPSSVGLSLCRQFRRNHLSIQRRRQVKQNPFLSFATHSLSLSLSLFFNICCRFCVSLKKAFVFLLCELLR